MPARIPFRESNPRSRFSGMSPANNAGISGGCASRPLAEGIGRMFDTSSSPSTKLPRRSLPDRVEWESMWSAREESTANRFYRCDGTAPRRYP